MNFRGSRKFNDFSDLANVEGWAKKEGIWAESEKVGKECILWQRVNFRGQRKFSDATGVPAPVRWGLGMGPEIQEGLGNNSSYIDYSNLSRSPKRFAETLSTPIHHFLNIHSQTPHFTLSCAWLSTAKAWACFQVARR